MRPARPRGESGRPPAPPRGVALFRHPSPPLRPLGPEELPGRASIPLPKGKVVVVVNDDRRPTPTPWLIERLDVDWKRQDIFFAVASGSHHPPGEDELRRIFGHLLEKVRPGLVLHRPAGSAFISAGRTSRGTPVEINPCLEGAAEVICLGSVEPHYFAAWTGGRKSIVPGLCSLETMKFNHRLALEGGEPGRPEVSPVHDDLTEALDLVERRLGEDRRVTALNVVAAGGGIHGFHHGPLRDAVGELAPTGRRVFGRPVGEPFDLVICRVFPPLDRDLYQALKAFENWKSAVAPGGTLLLAAGCAAGLGPPTFRQFLGSPPFLEELLRAVERNYRLGDHKLVSLLRFLDSGRSLIVVSGGPLPAGQLAVRVVGDMDVAIAEAAAGGRPLRALLVDDAGHLYPLRRGSGEEAQGGLPFLDPATSNSL